MQELSEYGQNMLCGTVQCAHMVQFKHELIFVGGVAC